MDDGHRQALNGFALWIIALDRRGEPAAVEDAVAADARIERHGPLERGAPPGEPLEVFVGVAEVGRWLRRLPPRVTWVMIGQPIAEGDTWRVEYAISVDGFDNGGEWLARFDADGRLAYLSHRPFPLAAKWR